MPKNIEDRNIKSSREDSTPDSSSAPPFYHGTDSNIDDINGHPSGISHQGNVMFPGGKFFGLFPRMSTVDEQIQVSYTWIVKL